MIPAAPSRLRSDRSKAKLSLLLNYASRAPSIIGLLIFIPLVHRHLGDVVYGDLMAGLALGGIASALFGGGNMLGRRRIGEGIARGDCNRQAIAFLTLCKASMLAAAIGLVAVIAFVLKDHRGPLFLAIAILPLFNSLTGALDEARAAFNEHYLTALLQLALQLIAYAIALTVDWVPGHAGAAALVIVGPSIVASAVAGTLLLTRRRYLLDGTGQPAWKALREGLPIGLIDDLVMLLVNLSVVLIQSDLPAAAGAWYVTLVRLFLLITAPVVLTLVPLTSYVRGIWDDWAIARQSRVLSLWVALSVGYGVAAALALAAADHFYIAGIMRLRSPIGPVATLPLYAGLAAIVTFKCFGGFGYMMLPTRQLNQALGTVLAVVIVAGAAGYAWAGSLAAVQAGGLALAVGTPLAMLAIRARMFAVTTHYSAIAP